MTAANWMGGNSNSYPAIYPVRVAVAFAFTAGGGSDIVVPAAAAAISSIVPLLFHGLDSQVHLYGRRAGVVGASGDDDGRGTSVPAIIIAVTIRTSAVPFVPINIVVTIIIVAFHPHQTPRVPHLRYLVVIIGVIVVAL